MIPKEDAKELIFLTQTLSLTGLSLKTAKEALVSLEQAIATSLSLNQNQVTITNIALETHRRQRLLAEPALRIDYYVSIKPSEKKAVNDKMTKFASTIDTTATNELMGNIAAELSIERSSLSVKATSVAEIDETPEKTTEELNGDPKNIVNNGDDDDENSIMLFVGIGIGCVAGVGLIGVAIVLKEQQQKNQNSGMCRVADSVAAKNGYKDDMTPVMLSRDEHNNIKSWNDDV